MPVSTSAESHGRRRRRGVAPEQRPRRRAQRRRGHGPDHKGQQENCGAGAGESHPHERDARNDGDAEDPAAVAREAGAHAVDPEAGDHVHHREHRLVGDQDPRHPALVDAGLRGELRQVEDVDRPGRREEELDDAEVEREPVADCGLNCSSTSMLKPLERRLVSLARPTTAISSMNIASLMPFLRARRCASRCSTRSRWWR